MKEAREGKKKGYIHLGQQELFTFKDGMPIAKNVASAEHPLSQDEEDRMILWSEMVDTANETTMR